MPGRHSGSSNLGGGFSGGGASFGGGPNFGGNWGGGWGGGWRPRGPWNPGPNFGGGWGGGWLLAGLLPWLFAPRFGRGGGCGCGGGLGCFMFLCIFLFCVMSGGLGSLRGIGSNYYGDGVSYGPNYGSGPVSSGNTGLSSEPPQVQTQTALDLSEMHAALDSRIAEWQRTLSTDEYHSISGPEAGLTRDNNTKEVVYGKCGQALYVFVVLKTKPDTGPADAEGYAYTTANSPGSCRPPAYAVYDSQDVGGGWWFVTLKSQPDANLGR